MNTLSEQEIRRNLRHVANAVAQQEPEWPSNKLKRMLWPRSKR